MKAIHSLRQRISRSLDGTFFFPLLLQGGFVSPTSVDAEAAPLK